MSPRKALTLKGKKGKQVFPSLQNLILREVILSFVWSESLRFVFPHYHSPQLQGFLSES